MRKILYSPGYGAGWSTWMPNVPKNFVCTYQPIIDALENGDKLYSKHPAIVQFVKDCYEKFNADVYIGGLGDLTIYQCADNTKVRIDEYDGSESVVEEGSEYF